MKAKTYTISLWERFLDKEYNDREKERLAILKASVNALKGYFKDKNVKQVFLVGSILKKGSFYPFSDIDVAVGELKVFCKMLPVLGRLRHLVYSHLPIFCPYGTLKKQTQMGSTT